MTVPQKFALFIKNLSLIDGDGKEWNFKRMVSYSLPEPYLSNVISQGYAVALFRLNDLDAPQWKYPEWALELMKLGVCHPDGRNVPPEVST